MENIGVAVGIIIDTMAGSGIMSDDGTGSGIRIPSMLISKKDGERLLNWYYSATSEEKDQVVIMAYFETKFNEDNKVQWDFFMTSSSDRSLDFLEDFSKLQKAFGDTVEFTPHYVFWECVHCQEAYLQKDCLGGGKYCAVEPTN